jgi:hypothetical protein
MARIGGDVSDLPAGWEVDADNWGRRFIRNGDCDRLKRAGKAVRNQSFLEDGFIYTMTALSAAQIDNA